MSGMSSFNRDKEETVAKIHNSFYEKKANQSNDNDMWTLIELLMKEIEIGKEQEVVLENSLKLCLQDDDANINTKYVNLKEKYEKLEKENVEIKTQLENLQTQTTMEMESQKNDYLRKSTETEDCYKREISDLRNQIENDKTSYEAKEQQLYNELQLAQASTALQCDEIESKLKRQLVDASSKLRQSQNMVRNLQMELNNLKNQLPVQHTPSTQKLPKTDWKYQPLPLGTHNTNGEETGEIDFAQAPPTRGGAHVVFKGIGTPKKKYSLPPLKQCTNAGTTPPSTTSTVTRNKSFSKKRKLYNPDDVDYLQDLQDD